MYHESSQHKCCHGAVGVWGLTQNYLCQGFPFVVNVFSTAEWPNITAFEASGRLNIKSIYSVRFSVSYVSSGAGVFGRVQMGSPREQGINFATRAKKKLPPQKRRATARIGPLFGGEWRLLQTVAGFGANVSERLPSQRKQLPLMWQWVWQSCGSILGIQEARVQRSMHSWPGSTAQQLQHIMYVLKLLKFHA